MTDDYFMQQAYLEAKKGAQYAAPNPMVGAVIVLDDKIIASGYHKKYGEAHAEVNAVNAVKDKSILKQATIYVTLEPCAHFGKTPPCANLIVENQFKRCVIACLDTFSEVCGKGVEKIKNAGIEVSVGVLEEKCRYLNRRFFTYHEKKRPYVILKWAQTKDGFIDRLAAERKDGVNWITQPETKKEVHTWRSKEQAILVGWKTVVNDDPSLTVREISGKNPHRYIIDPHFKSKGNYKVYTDKQATTVFVAKETKVEKQTSVSFVALENFEIKTILAAIYKNKHLSVFVEGGSFTLQKFIEAKLWDEARVLEGETYFEKGISAPKLTLENAKTTQYFGKDTFYLILNK